MGRRPRGLAGPLAVVERRQRAHEDAFAVWQASLSEPGDHSGRQAADQARRRAAGRLVLARGAFLPWAWRHNLPAAKWAIAEPNTVADCHGPRLAGDAAAFPPPTVPAVTQLPPIAGPHGDECWLKFAAPARTGGAAWVQVYEATGRRDPPTLIFLHGIGVEPVFWPYRGDPINALAASGVRVVRPEAPWHGLRRLAGNYSGEPVFAQGPLGLIDLFAAWISEIGILIAWTRRTSRGPVALGGVSLGALVAQRLATAAHHWPAELQPDALLLISTSGDFAEIGDDGALGRALGMPDRLAAHGWSPPALAQWLPLIEPRGPPVLASDRIVMVLGAVDRVTPIAGGRALAQRWRVPADNCFIRRGGHFSAAVGIGVDAAPLHRLLEVL